MLTYTKSIEQGATILHFDGCLNAITVVELRELLLKLLQEEVVFFDLTKLEQIDSSGVGAVVSFMKRMNAKQSDFAMFGLHGQPQAIFDLLGITKVFNLFPCYQTCLESYLSQIHLATQQYLCAEH